MVRPFLDSDILLRHLFQDDSDESTRATAYLSLIEQDQVRVRTAITVVFEVVLVLEHVYNQPKGAIRDVLLPLLDMPGIILPGKQRLAAAFDIYVERDVPFTTAYHVALMEHFEITEIASFDPTYDEIEGIQRVKL